MSKTVRSLYIFTLLKHCSRLYKSAICLCLKVSCRSKYCSKISSRRHHKAQQPCLSSNVAVMRAHHGGRSDEERSISLISHASKVMLKILLNRLTPQAEMIIAEEEAGFRPGRSTTEQIFSLRIQCERYRQHQQDLFHDLWISRGIR